MICELMNALSRKDTQYAKSQYYEQLFCRLSLIACYRYNHYRNQNDHSLRLNMVSNDPEEEDSAPYPILPPPTLYRFLLSDHLYCMAVLL